MKISRNTIETYIYMIRTTSGVTFTHGSTPKTGRNQAEFQEIQNPQTLGFESFNNPKKIVRTTKKEVDTHMDW